MEDMEMDSAQHRHLNVLDTLPKELLALIFSLVRSPRDRCSFYQSCKTVNQNEDINHSLAKLVLLVEEETRRDNLLADLVAFKRPLKQLVLCSRAPSTARSINSNGGNSDSSSSCSSGNFDQWSTHIVKWSPALREPRDAHSLLVDLALAAGQNTKARERLATANTLVLQAWALGTIPQSLHPLLEHCSGLQHLHFQGCMISLRLEPLFLCSHLEHQLQSLSLRTCHINCGSGYGSGLTTLDFLGRLRGLSSLELGFQSPMVLRRSDDPGRRACVSLWALSSLVNLRMLIIYYDDAERPMSNHMNGAVGCFAGMEGVARHCTRLTHMTFMGDIYERPAWLLQQAIAEGHAFPSLQSIALPATSTNAIASLLGHFPRPLDIRGEVGIRLPISRPFPLSGAIWPDLLDPEEPPSLYSPLEEGSISRLLQLLQLKQQLQGEHTWQAHQAGLWGRRHTQNRYIAEETTRSFVEHGVARNQSRAQEARNASYRVLEQIKEVEQQMLPLMYHVPRDLAERGYGRGLTTGDAAWALASKAATGMATSLSLKPHWPGPRRGMLGEGGRLIRSLSPLSHHVLHFCAAHLHLDGPSDAATLVGSLPHLQSLRLEQCKLQPAIGMHLDPLGNEQLGKDGGLAVIMKGLKKLTKLELLGGEMEGDEVLDAAAKASSLVSSRHTHTASPLPRLHLKCVGVQGVNAEACTQQWSQRQEAYKLFEDQPMRVVLTIIEQ